MLQYTDNEIKKIVSNILNRQDIEVNPCGNHHLKRHLVYEVLIDGIKKFIFKLYYKTNRRNKELEGLTLLKDIVQVPKIIQYGNLENDLEWLMTKYIDGVILDSVFNQITLDNQHIVFYEVGQALGKMHSNTKKKHKIQYLPQYVKQLNHLKCLIDEINLKEKGLLIDTTQILDINQNVFDVTLEEAYVHHDFDGRNILVRAKHNQYHLSSVIDFEGSSYDIYERDLVGLFYRYFIKSPNLKEAFFSGYEDYNKIEDGFYRRLPLYLLYEAVSNCSWAYHQAPDYYDENIAFIKEMKMIYSL